MNKYNKEILSVGISLEGEIQSEGGFGDDYKIYLAYRDKATGKFELISNGTLEKQNHGGTLGFEVGKYNISGENIKIYGEGKEIVFVFNGKYRKLKFDESNVLGGTIFLEKDYFDFKPKDKSDLMEDNYIENSVKEANDPFFDEFVQSYIIEERMNRNINESGVSNEEYNEYAEKYGNESALNSTLVRQKELEQMIIDGKNSKDIFNYVFDKLQLKEDFKSQGFSEEDINFIRDNGINKSMSLIEKYSVPERIQKINDKLIENKNKIEKERSEESSKYKKQLKLDEENREFLKKDVFSEITPINNNEEINLKKEGNDYGLFFIIGFILFAIIFSLIFIKYKIKKKRN